MAGNLFDWHSHTAEISWFHAKKKDDSPEASDAECTGQSSSSQNHEKGAGDQASEVNRDVRYLAFTHEFLEVVLKNQCDILEQLTILARSMTVLSEWAENNWSRTHVRGPQE